MKSALARILSGLRWRLGFDDHEHSWEFCHFPFSEGYWCVGYRHDYSRCDAQKDVVRRECQKCEDGLHTPDASPKVWYAADLGPPYPTIPHWREEAGIARRLDG